MIIQYIFLMYKIFSRNVYNKSLLNSGHLEGSDWLQKKRELRREGEGEGCFALKSQDISKKEFLVI